MSLTLEIETNKKHLVLNMSKRVKDNSTFLHQLAGEVKGEATTDASRLVELYETRKIPQARTVKKLLFELQDKNEKKQKLGIDNTNKALLKYEVEKPITRRINKKTNMKETKTTQPPITNRQTKN